jgi:xanthine dehydrogenase accessory factor
MAEAGSVVADLPPSTFIVSITKGHQDDLQVLRAVLPRGFAYVGVIGSRSKGLSLRKGLEQEGFTGAQVEGFYCPLGEDFGSNEPIEISFSIIAQLLRVRDALFGTRKRGGAPR